MGGFLGGLAAGIGGGAAPLEHYNEQIRGLLESRRNHFADLLYQSAAQEVDPQRKADYLRMSSDLLKGADMGKIVPAFVKIAQTHHQNNEALQQVLPPPQQPKPQPGPAPPGQTPGTPVAAQPSSSPVQPQQQGGLPDITQGLQAEAPAQAPAPAIPSVQAAAQGPAPQAAQPSITPVQANQFLSLPSIGGYSPEELMQTPVGRQQLQPFLTNEAEFQRQHRFAQQELTWKKAALNEYMSNPEWDKVPPMLKAQWRMWASTPGQQMPSMGYGMAAMMNPFTQVVDASTLEQQHPGILEHYHIDPKQTPSVRVVRNRFSISQGDDTPTMVEGVNPGVTPITNADNTRSFAPKVPGVAGVAPSEAAPHFGTTPQGGIGFVRPNAMGNAHVAPGLVSPSALPQSTTSVQQIPGQLPTTTHTVRTRGTAAGGGATPTVPPVSAPGGGGGTGGGDALMQQKYQDWVDGKGASPSGRDLTALQSYAVSHGLPTPVALTAGAQKELSTIEDTLAQIKELKEKMESRGMSMDDSRKYYSDYYNYAHGIKATPNQDIWSGLSFAGLRSAAAAMRGSNSRAYQVISRALDHTPRPNASSGEGHILGLPVPVGPNWHLPETTHEMYGKLSEMESILSKGREEILQNQRKSGVIPGVGTSGAKTINTQDEYNALPSGAEYIDAQTGKRAKKP